MYTSIYELIRDLSGPRPSCRVKDIASKPLIWNRGVRAIWLENRTTGQIKVVGKYFQPYGQLLNNLMEAIFFRANRTNYQIRHTGYITSSLASAIDWTSVYENHPLGLCSSGSLTSPSLFFRRFSRISLTPSTPPTEAFPPAQSTTTGHLNTSRSRFAWERTWSAVAGELPVTKLARPPWGR